MRNFFLLATVAIGLASCQNEFDATEASAFEMKAATADYTAACSLPVTTVSGDITSNTTWDNDHVWEISGVVRVKNNATLTIEAGTYIKASATAGDPNGVLVITKTGKINAVGTSANPIIFTSYNLLDCDSSTSPSPGDFGGIVLLGDAPVNTGSTTNIIEGLDDQPNPSDFYFGGTNSSHDIGSMQYVRIEFAGRDLNGPNSGNEINGLTFGAVGNSGLPATRTKIHHIQVTYGLDDSFEWFGGTVNARYLIAFAQDDDGFDFDWGYTGRIDYALALADKNSTHSTSGGNPDSNGIELDNDASGSSNTPQTHPQIYNMSIIGVPCTYASMYENGAHIRRNGNISLNNSIITGYGAASNTWGMFIDSATGSFSNVEVYACKTSPFTSPSSITGVTEASGADFGMTQPFFNGSGSLSFSGATNGAFASGDWASSTGWTKFSGF